MDLPPYLIALGLFRGCELTAALIVFLRFRFSPTGLLGGSAFSIWFLAGSIEMFGIYLGYSQGRFEFSEVIGEIRPLFTAMKLVAYTMLFFALLLAPTAARYRFGGKRAR